MSYNRFVKKAKNLKLSTLKDAVQVQLVYASKILVLKHQNATMKDIHFQLWNNHVVVAHTNAYAIDTAVQVIKHQYVKEEK